MKGAFIAITLCLASCGSEPDQSMWWVMMIGMMIPAASPTILLYAHVHRHSNGAKSAPPTAAFLAGYLACWLGFALIAAGLQVSLIPPISMALASRFAAAGLLIAAGLYQLSPLKDACLSRCRSPALFLSRHYRPGPSGAFRVGVLHGAYCVGCCWLLMALLFVGGVMIRQYRTQWREFWLTVDIRVALTHSD